MENKEYVEVRNCRNTYTLSMFIKTGFSYVLTKLFWKNAKIVRYPVWIFGKKKLEYGAGLNLGRFCRFDIINPNKKTLKLGENCDLGDYTHISAVNSVKIGDNFLCGQFVYIGDSCHGMYKENVGQPLSRPDEAPNERKIWGGAVKIGNNVWVGEHSSILAGAEIGDGCIIGANSVVNSPIPKNCIAAGVPARVIKKWDPNKEKWLRVVDCKKIEGNV